MKLAQGCPDGDKKETSKDKSAGDFESMNNDFEYITTKQNKAFREEMKHDRMALQDIVTEIERSVKRSELESERLHQKLLDSLRSRISKLTHLISQVSKETEVKMSTDNQMIEKNVELINKGAPEAVAERQELHSEAVNVDSVQEQQRL
jgi:hypothetical protein